MGGGNIPDESLMPACLSPASGQLHMDGGRGAGFAMRQAHRGRTGRQWANSDNVDVGGRSLEIKQSTAMPKHDLPATPAEVLALLANHHGRCSGIDDETAESGRVQSNMYTNARIRGSRNAWAGSRDGWGWGPEDRRGKRSLTKGQNPATRWVNRRTKQDARGQVNKRC